ncbi:aspartate aminotransferase [Endozoicomonas montiporae]|uniref:Aminotransferase n=2 Tax=Endozoicomonas montiporae TaxID=1027273 RepID=A0A081N2P3_9GAMM|nr:aminotransferase class I/II-fold pyridoxal phosphate-dependent enzyme [Endozoicomonas montiporae]AMO57974.1 aspartate aminotransferase [Endozoicomonas montiporae CL-33]KEQ12716.1 aspartate aminotransferase [Endozoicomonas montiporae]
MIKVDQLNRNVRGLKPSATLRINEDSNRLIQQGRDIIKLGLGQSPFPVPEVVTAALRQHAHEKDYLPVKGLYTLRETVARYYQQRDGIPRKADDVLVGPGSKELIFNLQMACEGDLLIPAPSWVSYAPQAKLLGRKVFHLPTQPENQWRLQADELDAFCQQEPGRTRILILNYPSNPTGCSYDAESLKALSLVARKHGIIVVADEIYAETTFDGQHQSMSVYYPEGTVISSGLSKWCGAGGWRLGVMLLPDALRPLQEAMAVIASETFTSISAPTQYAACTAFSRSAALDAYLVATRDVLKRISSYMVRRLSKIGLEMEEPVGGFYLLTSFEKVRPKLEAKGIFSSESLCERLLDEKGVAVLPGSDFGLDDNQLYTRMAFVDFDGGEALDAINDSGLSGDAFVEAHCPKLVQACDRIASWLD